jgi:transcriptional regulator with XRE-family HTH domain
LIFYQNYGKFWYVWGLGKVSMVSSSIYERVKAIRKTLKLSQREFAKGVFVTQSYFADVELGKREMSERVIHLISMQYDVNKEWLKTGKGEMFTGSLVKVQLGQLTTIFKELDELLQEYLLQQAQGLLKIQKNQKKK